MAHTNPSDHENPHNMEESLPNLSLAGKLLISRKPTLSTFKYKLTRIWDCRNNLDVYDLGGGLYSFQFHRLDDKLRIFNGGPWYYQDGLILLTECNTEQITFTSAKVWVRIHDLPILGYNRSFAQAIGTALGRLCRADLPDEDGPESDPVSLACKRKFLRILVEIDLSKPLKRKQIVEVTGRDTDDDRVRVFTLKLSYERLPDFCYVCGFMGHVCNDCSLLHLVVNNGGGLPYSDKIRAENYYSDVVLPRDAMVISFNNSLVNEG